MEFCLYPIAHAAMLPFERGSQRSNGKRSEKKTKKGYPKAHFKPPLNNCSLNSSVVLKHLRLWKLEAECILMSS